MVVAEVEAGNGVSVDDFTRSAGQTSIHLVVVRNAAIYSLARIGSSLSQYRTQTIMFR